MRLSLRLSAVLAAGAAALVAGAPALSLPNQEITVGVPSGNYTKTTISEVYKGTAPYGFATEYGIFLDPKLAIAGQFELNLEPTKQSAVLLGGAAGLKYYVVGGDNRILSDTYVKGVGRPKLNAFLVVGFGGKQYDFSVPEKVEDDKKAGSIFEKDGKDLAKGSVVGLSVGLGAQYPIFFDLQPGFRVQMFKSFSAENQPDITVMAVWLSCGFGL